MPANDRFTRILLIIVALLLAANLFQGKLVDMGTRDAVAQQKLEDHFDFTGGVAIACSADGKYVYRSLPSGIVRSADYGAEGSWERVLYYFK
ncbi:MAG: hypothetical protein ACLFOY_18110 [Desulfatibacillaceae bacterium]